MFRSPGDVTSRAPVTKEPDRGDEKHYCDFCTEGWDSETEVEIHRNKEHASELRDLTRDLSKNVCMVCIKPHKDKTALIHHIKTWHLLSAEDAYRVERELYVCNECCRFFFNKRLITTHMLYYHLNVNKRSTFTECPKCLKSFRVNTLWYHYERHNIQSVACCRICLTKCKHKAHLLEHMKKHKKYLYCEICAYHTMDEALFRNHIVTKHRKRKTGPLVNTNRVSKYFIPLHTEYKLKHNLDVGPKGLDLSLFHNICIRICVLCREICIGKQEMIEHIQNDHSVEVPQNQGYLCNCGEIFFNKVLLKHHIFKLKGNHTEYCGSTSDSSKE